MLINTCLMGDMYREYGKRKVCRGSCGGWLPLACLDLRQRGKRTLRGVTECWESCMMKVLLKFHSSPNTIRLMKQMRIIMRGSMHGRGEKRLWILVLFSFFFVLFFFFFVFFFFFFSFFLDGTTVQCGSSPPLWTSSSQLCFLTSLSNF